jgi:hypothetical protein
MNVLDPVTRGISADGWRNIAISQVTDGMAEKLKSFLKVLAHTILSFIAALVAGFTFHAFFRPIVGRERYSSLARSPVMVVLLLIIVALWGMALYDKWHDRRAFFAWVLPALWVCHLLLSRGTAALQGTWADTLFFFEIGAAYSLGAVIASWVLRSRSGLLS